MCLIRLHNTGKKGLKLATEDTRRAAAAPTAAASGGGSGGGSKRRRAFSEQCVAHAMGSAHLLLWQGAEACKRAQARPRTVETAKRTLLPSWTLQTAIYSCQMLRSRLEPPPEQRGAVGGAAPRG